MKTKHFFSAMMMAAVAITSCSNDTMLTYSLAEHTGVEHCPWNDNSLHINIQRPTDEQIAEFWAYWDEASRTGNTL